MPQAEDCLPEQYLALPHSVAGTACFPLSAEAQAVSLPDVPGKAEARAATAPLPAPAQPACQCGGTQQIHLLHGHPVLMV